jgi:asparagine synthase (glutamine-hydrolysing)
MCGITAIFNSKDAKEKSHASLDKIQHRGGSVFEIENFDNASIGANRLPIVGRMSGKQPLHNEDKTIFAVQNGEIFNHKELRKELENLGHIFTSESDTEVLAHSYEQYGVEMVKKLDSEMFAFVIYNSKTKDVYAARDPIGVKPFYYTKTKDGEILFASELKQLVQFENVEQVFEFPQGHYYLNGKFTKYFEIKESKQKLTEHQSIRVLEENIVEAVKKRVDTDLPIGVFLSGGVDSSLVMEIATRFHPDVTAIILGNTGSSDYEYALRLCKDRGYKYQVVSPEIDYKQELDEVLYYLETYEPLIIRQGFANWICSREAQKLGLSIVLVGEGADELFAGYNEFSALSDDVINKGCKLLTENLGAGHLKRVDRGAMRFTVEVRSPFLDTKLVETAFKIKGEYKVKRENHRVTTKYIFRKVASNFLPDYIAWRYKMPFANGAGMNVGYNYKSGDGALGEITKEYNTKIENIFVKKFGLETAEENYYFEKFDEYKYTKLVNAEKRIIVKDVLQALNTSKNHRIVLAEFDKLALYFPVYLAAKKKIFDTHGLEVDFIATGGDDKTYATLLNNSGQIGISDPLFAMFEGEANPNGHGEIIGELVSGLPIVAIAINPSIKIDSIEDFSKYKIGTFQKYSTTNTVVSSLLKNQEIKSFDSKELPQKLIDRDVDIAIVLIEQGIDMMSLGGKIVFDFRTIYPQYLFSGFTVASTISKVHKQKMHAFLSSVKEAIKYIAHNNEESVYIFRELFPEIRNHSEILDWYKKQWVKSLKVTREDYLKSHNVWKSVYPTILKNHDAPFYRSITPTDAIVDKINDSNVRREYPFLEDRLRELIDKGLQEKTPLKLFGFWGAGSKDNIDEHDTKTIEHLQKYIAGLSKVYPHGIEVNFILADMHGQNNGYEKDVINYYLKEISEKLDSVSFKYIYLSDLWRKWNMDLKQVDESLKNKKRDWWESISIAGELEQKSENNFTGSDKKFGAQKYFVLRELEKTCLEKEYPDGIFFVYGDSMAQQIYPTMPTLYLFTEKKFFSPCPWFSNNTN